LLKDTRRNSYFYLQFAEVFLVLNPFKFQNIYIFDNKKSISIGSYVAFKYAVKQLKETFNISSKTFSMVNQEYLTLRKYEHFLNIKQTSDEAGKYIVFKLLTNKNKIFNSIFKYLVIELSKSLIDKIKTTLPCEDLLNQLKQKYTHFWFKYKI
jgi:hypothetical protein